MEITVKDKNSFVEAPGAEAFNPADWLPSEIGEIIDHQTDLPRIAKDPKAIAAIEARLSQVPKTHDLLVRMFSFVGDTVLDPFLGTGTTSAAAAKWGRNSIGANPWP